MTRREVGGFCLAGGVSAGLVTGVVDTVFLLRDQAYLSQGLGSLAAEFAVTGITRATLLGLAAGAAAFFAASALGAFSRPVLGWLRANLLRVEQLREDAARILFTALGISFWLQIVGGYFLNVHVTPHQRSLRALIANAILSAVCLALFPLITMVLSRLRFLISRRTAHRIALGAVVVALVAVGAARVAWSALRPRVPPGRPNIILLTVDTLRADHLGCYGYDRDTSPFLDAWSHEGRLFLRGYAHAPITNSSFASILTGMWPRETGTYGISPLAPQLPTLAERLRNGGYVTGAVVSNYVLRKGQGFEDGFASYDDEMEDRELVRRLSERVAPKTTDAALKWLARHKGEPFFLWVHYQDTHGPYTPPDSLSRLFLGSEALAEPVPINDTGRGDGGIPSYQVLPGYTAKGYYIAHYDGEIRYFDENLRRLVDGLSEMNLRDSTLICFTSDHGEGMGEHGYYFAHGDHLYNGLIHVPLILWGPEGFVTGGVTDSTLVRHIDIVPTILSAAGLSPEAGLRGRSLLRGTGREDPVLSEALTGDNYKASLTGRSHLVIYDHLNDAYRAFRLPSDVELDPTATPDVVGEMQRALEVLRNPGILRGSPPARRQNLTDDEVERLRSLGYIQ